MALKVHTSLAPFMLVTGSGRAHEADQNGQNFNLIVFSLTEQWTI